MEPGPPALGAQSLSHWTTRVVPVTHLLMPVLAFLPSLSPWHSLCASSDHFQKKLLPPKSLSQGICKLRYLLLHFSCTGFLCLEHIRCPTTLADSVSSAWNTLPLVLRVSAQISSLTHTQSRNSDPQESLSPVCARFVFLSSAANRLLTC